MLDLYGKNDMGMLKIILLGLVLISTFVLKSEGQNYCPDESEITRIDASTFVFNKKDQNQSSTKFIQITRGGVAIPYNVSEVSCLDYYVELSKAGAESQTLDFDRFMADYMGYAGKKCQPSIITTAGEIHAIGNINLHDDSPVTNAPTMSGFQGNDVGDATVLKLAFMDFGWSSAMTNTSIEEYDLKIVIKDHCNNQEKELFLAAGSWKVLETMRVIDLDPLDGEVKVEVSDVAVCQNDASTSVTASVTGITNPYTVSWAANGGTMPTGVTYSSSGAGKTDDVFNIDPALATAGTYNIRATVTDDTDNSITADTVFKVVVHPALQVAITTDESGSGGVCEGQPVRLSATPTGSGYTYKWTHTPTFGTDINMTVASADSSSVTGTLTGVAGGGSRKYTVEVTNTVTGCSATADTTITVKKKPTIKLEINGSPANTLAVCSGEAVTLTASNSIAADESKTTYQWITPASGGTTNSLTVYPTVATTYEVKGTVDGCSASVKKEVTINPKPDIRLTHNPDSVCALTLGGNGTVNLTTVGISSSVALTNKSYFQTLGGAPVTNPNSVTLAVGNHNFWLVGETNDHCKDTVAFTAKVNDLPGKPVITGTSEVCKGDKVNLGLQATDANSTYVWKNGGGSVGTGSTLTTYAPANTENLSVTVTDKNGCQNTSDAYAVTVNNLPTITFSTNPTVACAGATVRVSASITGGTAPYKGHAWTGVTNIAADKLSADLALAQGNTPYSLSIEDNKGCKASKSDNAYGHYLDVTLSAGGTVNIGSTVSLTAVTKKDGTAVLPGPSAPVKWTFKNDNTNDVLCGPSTSANTCNPVVSALTRYKVEVEDVNTGCTAWDTLTPHITPGAPLNVTPVEQPTLCYGETDFSGKYFVVKATNGLPDYSYSWTDIPSWLSYEDKNDTLKITGINWAQAVTTSVKCEVTDQAGDKKSISLSLKIRSLTQLAVNTQGNNGELKVCQHSGTNDQYALNVTKTAGVNLTSVEWLAPTVSSASANPLNVSTATANSSGTNYTVTGVDANNCPTDTVTVKVIVNELPPVITLAVTGDSVCPGTDVTVRIDNMGSEPASQYTWKINGSNAGSGQQQVVQNITAPTRFEVQRTDNNGCVTTTDTTIQVYVPEVLVLSEDQRVCETSRDVTLTASGLTGSGTYSWSSSPADAALSANAFTQNLAPTVTTTYYVDGTDVHGCTVARGSIVVTVDEMPTFALNLHTLSACGSVKLYDAVGTVSTGAVLKYGTTANFTGGTTFTATTPLSASGKYYVRAENGECKSNEDTVRVNILTAPQLKLLAATMEACAPDSIDLAANVNWTAGTGTTFDPTNLTYWNGDPAAGGTQLTSTKVYPGVTSKDYWVQGASDGCPSKKEKVTVTINPKPVLAISASDTAVCTPTADLNVAVNSDVAVTKTYFSNADYTTQFTSSEVTSGTYYVIGETGKGCKDSIDVTVRVKPHPVVTLMTSADTVCKDATASLTVNGGASSDTYSWKVNGAAVAETTATFTSPAITASTSVEVTVTNTEGCTTVLDTTIGVYTSTVTLAADGNCQGETVTITATLTGDGNATGYTWTGATQIGTSNQATLALTTSGQTVGVTVTTDKGCTVEAEREFIGRDCSSGDILIVEVADTTLCLSGEDMKLTAHSTGGIVTSWNWTQTGGPTLPSLTFADSVLTLPSTMALGTYQFEVSVNDGAAKDIAEVTIQQGVSITSLVALDSCSSNVRLEVTTEPEHATQYNWNVITDNCFGSNEPGNQRRYNLELTNNETEYKVAVKVSNGVCEAHDTLSGHIVNTGLDLSFEGNDTCGTNIALPIGYDIQGDFGDIVAKYTYLSQSGTLTEDSIRITPLTGDVTLTATNPGIYVLTKAYATKAPGCVVTVNDTLKIGVLPKVELEDNCLALHKDSTFILNIANSGDFDYIWSVSESSDGLTWTPGGAGDGTTTTTINGRMEDKDLQYIITATDKNLTQCKASDTAHIYRIPDAPVVDIDTIDDKCHIQLKWNVAGFADNYTVWSRKWDPYCLTGKDGNVYAAEVSGTNITALSWAEPQMDSLEFYYLTANRTICNVEYPSFATDTFGYARHIADGNITLTGVYSAYQYAFPYIFDMSRYGCTDLVSLVDYFAPGKLTAIGVWDKEYHPDGNWTWELANYLDFGDGTGMWLPSDNIDPLPLNIGDCPLIEVLPGERIEFVILGKLKDADTVSTTTSFKVGMTSLNIAYIPFRSINKVTSALLAGTNVSMISALGWWNFDVTDVVTDNYEGSGPGADWNSDYDPTVLFPNRAGYDVIFFDVSGSFVWP